MEIAIPNEIRKNKSEKTSSGSNKIVSEINQTLQKASWKRKCPYDFQDMFQKFKGNLTNAAIQKTLCYELFWLPDDDVDIDDDSLSTITDFMNLIDSAKAETNSIYGQALSPDSDDNMKKYTKQWNNNPGLQKENRYFLWSAYSKGNRLKEDDKKVSQAEIIDLFDKIEKYNTKFKEEFSEDGDIEIEDPFSIEEINKSLLRGDSCGKSFRYIIRCYQQPMIEIVPCCPHCLTLLPDNWFSERLKAYEPIALVAPPESGKTAYMTSLLSERSYELLAAISLSESVSIRSGISDEKRRMAIQSTRFENLEKMTKKGLYPQGTVSNTVYPPVFLMLTEKNKEEDVLIGVFDSAGEDFKTLTEYLNASTNARPTNGMKFLKSVKSIIYFIEKKNMHGLETLNRNNNMKYTPLPLSEQANIQQTEESILISDLKQTSVSSQNDSPMQIIEELIIGMEDKQKLNSFPLEHIAYTIMKSDEFLPIKDEIEKQLDKPFEFLLENDETVNFRNEQQQNFKQEVLKAFFDKYIWDSRFPDRYSFNACPISLHCVRVAIDLNEEKNGEKKCEWSPVRIAEPLMSCISETLKKLGWIQ